MRSTTRSRERGPHRAVRSLKVEISFTFHFSPLSSPHDVRLSPPVSSKSKIFPKAVLSLHCHGQCPSSLPLVSPGDFHQPPVAPAQLEQNHNQRAQEAASERSGGARPGGNVPLPCAQREPAPQLVTTAPGGRRRRLRSTPLGRPRLFSPAYSGRPVWFQTQRYYQHLGARGAKPETSCTAKTAKATVQ